MFKMYARKDESEDNGMKIGQVCIKIAGRDAGKYCVVIEEKDPLNVLIEGQTRRRKCNICHLEATGEIVSVKKGASKQDVAKALSELEIKVDLKEKKIKDKKEKPKKRIKKKNE
ncbi:MAG TPA: hypothetical protein VJB89_03310 [Candidatus Nanoarchaeia archaeon]|nr:hypothetical protein [Candidatus Nanoarchaeia archaeon]